MANEHPMPASPLPWKWADGWKGGELPTDDEEFSGGKYVDCQLGDAHGDYVIPLRIDHYERIWDTSAEDGLQPRAEDRAYIEWAANNAPSLAAENARLRAALAIALECLEETGGVQGPSTADCEDAAKLTRAALEAK